MSRTRSSEAGFTLAALIVTIAVMTIAITYTVPKQWSMEMARERDRQTIFIMKQYAQAIRNWQLKNGSPPTSLDQLKEARTPRFMRGVTGEWICPLTGKADWIAIPAGQQQGQQMEIGPDGRPRPVTNPANPQQQQPQQPQQRTSMGPQQGQIIGPIVGVRPNKQGKSFLTLNNSDSYENWQYTVQDLENEINGRRQALMVK